MKGKELQAHFKSANWGGPKGVEAFVTQVGEVDTPDLVKLLGILTTKKLQADARRHQMRCDVFAKLAVKTDDKELFAHYLGALKAADPVTRNTLVPLIPRVNNVHKHDALCNLLKSSDAQLRQQVAQVMKQVGGKTVLRTLQELVLTHGFRGRVEAAQVAVEIAGHYAVGLLRDVLDVGDPSEKTVVLGLLANHEYMGRDLAAARDAIASVLKDRNDNVVVQAITSYTEVCDEEHFFEKLGEFLDDPGLGRVKAAVAGLRRFSSARVCEAMDKAFRTGPDVIRALVLDNLEHNGSDDMLPLLVEALSFPKVTIRTRAAEVFTALSKKGTFDPSSTILWLLRSQDPKVRRMAAEVVASVEDPHNRLWPKLLTFLKDADWWVRERVTDGLVRIAGEQLTRYLVGFLTDPSDIVRRFAVDKLGNLGDPKALGAIVRTAQGDPDW
jgi:HEAT repeat protein